MAIVTPEQRAEEISILRVLINDDEEYSFSDEKLTVFLSFYDSEPDSKYRILRAAILIVSTLAQKYASSVGTRIKINNIEREVTKDQSDAYNSLLKNLEAQYKSLTKSTIVPIIFGGGIKLSEKRTAEEKYDSGIVPPIFEDNQFEFPPTFNF